MAGQKNDPIADKEKAEGDRETVDAALKNAESDGHQPQGISNKPIDEEEAQRREVPPRGHAKRED